MLGPPRWLSMDSGAWEPCPWWPFAVDAGPGPSSVVALAYTIWGWRASQVYLAIMRMDALCSQRAKARASPLREGNPSLSTTIHTTGIAAVIDERRLWERHMTMAKIGATSLGRVNHQAFSPGDSRARQLLVALA